MGDDRISTRNDDFDPARARKSQAQIDLEDHAAELTSAHTPKTRRFTNEDALPGQISKKERDARDAARATRLQILLMNADYARAHGRLMVTLAEAQDEFEAALQQSVTAIERLEALSGEIEAAAARLPDGRMVFRDSAGVLSDGTGKILDRDDLPASLPDPEDAQGWSRYPSWEQYDGTRKALAKARARRNENAQTLDDIAAIRERARNEDNPMTKEELDEAEKRIQSKLDDLRDQQKLKPTFRDQLTTAEGDIAGLFPASGQQATATPQ